jgi:Flp pilus assembly protein CpaB
MRHPLLALASTVLSVGLLGTPTSANDPDRAPTTDAKENKVLVARRAVSPLMLIREPERLFVWKPCPPDAVPPDAIRSFADLKGERLNKPLPAGQVVRKADVLTKEQAGGSSLPPLRRLVALRLPRDAFACDQLRPGMRVDLYVTMETADGRTTRRLLTNVPVRCVDPDPSKGKPAAGPTVTFENVSPEDATRLALAAALGSLSVKPSPTQGR